MAQAEGLDLQARRRNPAGQGMHNKRGLAQIGGKGWVGVGSQNDGEVSAKLNREMALLRGSRANLATSSDRMLYSAAARTALSGDVLAGPARPRCSYGKGFVRRSVRCSRHTRLS
jgi:hypothetical protein